MNLINKKVRRIGASLVAILIFFYVASIDSILASVDEGVRSDLLYEELNFSDDSESGMQGHREDHLIGSEPDEEEGSFVGQTNPIEEDAPSQEEVSESEAVEETRFVPFSSETVTNLTQLNAAVGRANAGETTEIVIAYPGLTITGAAFPIITATDLTIRGETEDTVVTVTRAQGFQVNGNASSRANVRFEDLILDGASGGSRTAIWLQGGFVTTRNVEIRNFTNSGIRGDGGAVAGSQLNLESGTFIHTNHVTGAGGGISVNNSRIYMEEGVTIYNNTASTNGGGIAVGGENAAFPGVLTMTGGRIEGNRANTSGGGIHLPAGRRLYVSGGLVYDNEALGGTGGGINAIGAIASLTDEATVEFNRSSGSGGGIHSTASLTVSDDVEIINNQAGTSGGGIHGTNVVTISDDVLIDDNHAGIPCIDTGEVTCALNRPGSGGGLSITGSLSLSDDVRISNNHAHGANGDPDASGGGGFGGGIFSPAVTTIGNNVTIYGNHANTQGGGIHANAAGGVMVGQPLLHLSDNVRLEANTSVGSGGGAHTNRPLTLGDEIQVLNNEAGVNGGGLSVTNDLTIEDQVYIYGNMATSNGGGLHSTGTTTITDDVIVENNRAQTNGGGVSVTTAGRLYLAGNAQIIDNHALGTTAEGTGGGIISAGNFTMSEQARIADNTSSIFGGGIRVTGSFTMMDDAVVENNTAGTSGGGVSSTGVTVLRDRALIYDNHAGTVGGGITVNNNNLTMRDEASVTSNEAESSGGGVAVTGDPVSDAGLFVMEHQTIIYDNHTGGSGGGVIAMGDFVMRGTARVESNSGVTGGGIAIMASGSFTMNDHALITNNHANGQDPEGVGGGISTFGMATINDQALIYNNRANLQGGGIHVGGTGTLVIQSEPDFASLYRNRAGTSGGGMVTFGRAELRSGIVAGNTAVSNGGGVNVATSMGRFYMPGGIIVGNRACGTSENNGFGGGISITGQFFMGDSMPNSTTIAVRLPQGLDSPEVEADPLVCEPLDTIDVSDIDGDSDEPLIIRNVAGNAGGGVSPLQNPDASVGGRAFMNRGRITENVGKGTGGGGVNLQGIHTFFTMSGEALIDRNEALSGHGGGIRSVNGTIVIEENATVEYNLSNGHGGGIHAGGSYPNGSLVEMRGGFIQHNEAIRNGGGVNLDGQSRLIMEGTDADHMASIVNNQAGARGGGVSLDGFIANVMNPIQSTASATMNAYSRVSDNVAGMYGGGFYVIGQNIITLNEGAEILRNTATTGGGIRLAIRGRLYMNEGLIQHNTASGGGGGGISLPGSTGNVAYMVMSGGEISENTAVFGGGIGFTAVTNWNMLNTALNRVTIHNTGTTVARNTAVDLVNGIELWGAYPSNPRNTQIRPTNYTLFNEFAVASGWGYNGEGINRFALTNFDIQSQELTRRVTFAAMGPGVVDPNNIVLTVGLGDTIGEENSIPTPIPDSVSSQVCEFTHWISDSSHHWSSDGEYPSGNPNTPFTTEQIRNDLAILEDTVFTAVFSCYPDYVTVDFEAPGGTLRDPNNNNLLDPNDVRLSVVSGNTIAATDLVPRAVHDSSYYEFMYWTSSDPAHPAEISPEEIRDLEITQDTVFTAHFRRMTMPITGIGHPTYFLPLALFALVLIATLFYYRRWKSHVSSR